MNSKYCKYNFYSWWYDRGTVSLHTFCSYIRQNMEVRKPWRFFLHWLLFFDKHLKRSSFFAAVINNSWLLSIHIWECSTNVSYWCSTFVGLKYYACRNLLGIVPLAHVSRIGSKYEDWTRMYELYYYVIPGFEWLLSIITTLSTLLIYTNLRNRIK